MTETVGIPLWLVIMGSALAAWAVLKLLLLPGLRWYFRRRTSIVLSKINDQLDVRLPTFKLTKRKVIIDRLVYDEKLQQAIVEHCREEGISSKEAMRKVKRYANEIVPAFNALVYFRFGSGLSKSLLRLTLQLLRATKGDGVNLTVSLRLKRRSLAPLGTSEAVLVASKE